MNCFDFDFLRISIFSITPRQAPSASEKNNKDTVFGICAVSLVLLLLDLQLVYHTFPGFGMAKRLKLVL